MITCDFLPHGKEYPRRSRHHHFFKLLFVAYSTTWEKTNKKKRKQAQRYYGYRLLSRIGSSLRLSIVYFIILNRWRGEPMFQPGHGLAIKYSTPTQCNEGLFRKSPYSEMEFHPGWFWNASLWLNSPQHGAI